MFCKSLLLFRPQIIYPIFFIVDYSSVALIPSTTVFNPARNVEEPHESSQRNITHLNESHANSSIYSNASKIWAKAGSLSEGKQLHCYVTKLNFENEVSLQNQVLDMYLKCGFMGDAHQLFDEMPKRNIVSWNIIISGYDRIVKNGLISCSTLTENWGLFFFRKMLLEMVEPNYITFISVLGLCIKLEEIELGKQIHSRIVKSGFCSSAFVGSALVDLYAKCKFIQEAWKVFDEIESRDLVSWNVMISGYAQNSLGNEAFKVFDFMRKEGHLGDGFTFASLLNCSSILGYGDSGKQIHGLIIRLALDSDVPVASALVDVYAKSGYTEDARKTFDGMSIRNVVSWTTMIVGYGQNGAGEEALMLFRQMLRGRFRPDELTLASILSSCANLAAASEAHQIHTYVIRNGFEAFVSVQNALITAHAKCGSISCVFHIFRSISEPNIVSWSSTIGAYAFHGLSTEAINLFETMLQEGMHPDRIAFVGVLSACSHGGLVNEGLHYFNSMRRDHHVIPDMDHYACLVDLLARAGRLDEAYQFLRNMPFEPNIDVLRAFLGACKIHGNMGLAKWAASRLFELEPEEPVNYALMSNAYAAVGCWDDVAETRKMMRNKCGKKTLGCSWTQIGSKVHTFVSNDKSHPNAAEVYIVLEMLIRLMKEEDYWPSMRFFIDDVGDEYVLEQ